jgi:hypothetical protein
MSLTKLLYPRRLERFIARLKVLASLIGSAELVDAIGYQCQCTLEALG